MLTCCFFFLCLFGSPQHAPPLSLRPVASRFINFPPRHAVAVPGNDRTVPCCSAIDEPKSPPSAPPPYKPSSLSPFLSGHSVPPSFRRGFFHTTLATAAEVGWGRFHAVPSTAPSLQQPNVTEHPRVRKHTPTLAETRTTPLSTNTATAPSSAFPCGRTCNTKPPRTGA